MFQTKHNMLYSSIGLFALLFSLAPVCFAGVNAAPYLGVGTGARSLGLGGAFTAIADDATSTVWNPAGLPSVKDLTFTVSTAKLSLDRKHNFIGIVKNFNDKSALGLAVINVGVDDIIRYDDQGEDTGERFNFSSNAFSVSYGVALEKISLGGSVRLLTDSFGLNDVSGATGFGGIDLGFLGHANYATVGESEIPTINYGVALKHLGGSISGGNLPVLLDLGVAFKVLRKNVATFAFDLEREFVDLEESTTSVRIGAEYLIAQTFAIRAGAKATRDRRSLFAGFGVNVGGIQLDYALQPDDSTTHKLGDGNTHFVSLSYSY